MGGTPDGEIGVEKGGRKGKKKKRYAVKEVMKQKMARQWH